MCSVIQTMIEHIDDLESIDIGEIYSVRPLGTFSVEDFLENCFSHSLKHLRLTKLDIVDYQDVVYFVRGHTDTLKNVELLSVELMNGTCVTMFPASHTPG